MTDKACLAFINAAAREFNAIVDTLAKANCTAPIRDAGADKGLLLPVQVATCF